MSDTLYLVEKLLGEGYNDVSLQVTVNRACRLYFPDKVDRVSIRYMRSINTDCKGRVNREDSLQ